MCGQSPILAHNEGAAWPNGVQSVVLLVKCLVFSHLDWKELNDRLDADGILDTRGRRNRGKREDNTKFTRPPTTMTVPAVIAASCTVLMSTSEIRGLYQSVGRTG